jgi:pSer/pThr/pTyr-binding forkhead associated (FHA) protein
LNLTNVPELADIPWEYLYNPALDRFLALSVETPLVRYLDLPERVKPLEVKLPLRLLVMISSPDNHPQLDVEQEWAKLKQALADLVRHGIVELERLKEATLTALQRRLRQKQFHIFHFIGHGCFDQQAQDGMLILEDENKMGRPVSGKYLGTLVHDERTLRLAFLNACEGARSSCNDPFAGTAQSLVQQGIPAVVAMQFEMTDKTAVILAREFYAALSDGYPVDAALTEARKAIFTQGNDVEWGTPVLYMRAPDGRIFDMKNIKDALKTIIAGDHPSASLIVRQGTQVGQKYPLQAGANIIGREKSLALALVDSQVSRQHAQILWVAGQYLLEDLGSANGTFVNDEQITGSRPLKDGDLICVGNTLLAFQIGKESSIPPDIDKPHDTELLPVEPEELEYPKTQRAHVFLSYKRGISPDEPLALQLFDHLSKEHEVFIDQNMVVGTLWAERIEAELKRSDFLIVLLSSQSINSEMVKAEIETAHRLGKEQGGRLRILPVRLAYRDPFPYPLSAYLDHINWAYWKGEEFTPLLIDELMQAIAGGALSLDKKAKSELLQKTKLSTQLEPLPAAQPVQLEMPEGTMDPESKFYVERDGDRIALSTIERQGVTITIKAPRQMGKSSLLIRVMQAAQKAGKRVVFLDFQLFDKSTLTDADIFFRQFCTFISDELEMEDRSGEYWQMPLGNSQRCTRYVERCLLKELGEPLVLAMDEVESIFDTDFRSDFFSMLRNWHNSRATKPIWKQLDLALVTSTEPYQLVENLNQSPFNVGEVIDLPDFTPEQVADLNQRHGAPLSTDDLSKLMTLLGGHPYLTRRALYLVASQRLSTAELFAKATEDRGPFGDHLRYHLFRLYGKENLIQGLRQVIRNNKCPDERIFFRLRGAGLVRRQGGAELPRCQLYADYFREHLNV